MRGRKPLRKTGRYNPPRGVRLPRKKVFGATLATASGVKVRSSYEQKCADYLHSVGIKFVYEPLMLLAGRQYRPDFYLPEHNLFLELCGFNHMPFYVDRIKQKRELYRKHGLRAVFVNYNGRGSLERILKRELEVAGVSVVGKENKDSAHQKS
jgi:DNA helicase-4